MNLNRICSRILIFSVLYKTYCYCYCCYYYYYYYYHNHHHHQSCILYSRVSCPWVMIKSSSWAAGTLIELSLNDRDNTGPLRCVKIKWNISMVLKMCFHNVHFLQFCTGIFTSARIKFVTLILIVFYYLNDNV